MKHPSFKYQSTKYRSTKYWSTHLALVTLLIGASAGLHIPAWSASDTPPAIKTSLVPLMADGLTSPNLIADVAERVAPSVVSVEVEKPSNAGPQQTITPFSEELLRRFFGFNPEPNTLPEDQPSARLPQTVKGNGSGVVLDTDGHILTNFHVVNQASHISVTLNDGRHYTAQLVGKDRLTDLALLKISTNGPIKGLEPAQLGSSEHLRPGEWVLAIGSPLGFDHTVTAGIISALSRRVPDLNNNVQFIQTDAAINPGNSGGPLINLKGEVIGINTAISGMAQNIGFAIPVDTVRQVSHDLITAGKVSRPWVGMGLGVLSPQLAKALGVPEQTEGVVVSQVLPNSPSAKAGLHQGDIIQRLDGKKITDPKTLQDAVRKQPVNSTFNIQVLREGQLLGFALKTEWMPDDTLAPTQPTPQPSNPSPFKWALPNLPNAGGRGK
jgi:serine protease Do